MHGYTDAQGNFRQGPPAPGTQAAQRVVESDFQRHLRGLIEPATGAVANRLIADNVINMPETPEVRSRDDVARALFDRSYSQIKPAMEQTQTRLLNNLQARGLPVGGEAFNEAYGEQLERTQDAIARLGLDAVLAAGDEQTRQYNLDARRRSDALGEIGALITGRFQPQAPLPTGGASPVNYSNLVGQQYNAQMAQYNADQQRAASSKGLLGSLGAAGIMAMSSRDFKEDHGQADAGAAARAVQNMPVHRWRYRPDHRPPGDTGEVHIGPMAEDFWAATGFGDGRAINLIDANGVLTAALQHALARIEALEARLAETEAAR